MIDLSSPQQGELGPALRFSDLYVAALQGQFTGGLLLQTAQGRRVLFFQNGDPVNARGDGFPDAYLGQMVTELGFAGEAAVIEALRQHESIPSEQRPRFGEVLNVRLGVDKEAIEQAVRAQCEVRFQQCFELEEASYQAAPGDSEAIRGIAVRTEGWPILFSGMLDHAGHRELRAMSDALLGRSVKMSGSPKQLEELGAIPPDIRSVLKLLDRPRRPEHIERLLGRPRARRLLRLLQLMDLLELQPASRGEAIPRAVRIAGSTMAPPAAPPEPPPPPKAPPPPRPSKKPTSSGAHLDSSQYADLLVLSERLEDMDHFEILGVNRQASPDELRKAWTERAKRFHPDLFRGSDLPDAAASMAKDVLARINKAYEVLKRNDSRMEYEAMLADGHGETHERDRARDAKNKFLKGLTLLNGSKYGEARVLLRAAVDGDPHNQRYKGYLAWSMLGDSSFDQDEALKEGLPMLEASARAAEDDPKLQLYLGRVFKRQGELEKAILHFKRAARIDPKFTGALSEVRHAQRQLEGARRKDESPGIFKRVLDAFGSKPNGPRKKKK